MTFTGVIHAILGFRTIPTSVLLVLIYAAIFSTVLVTDDLPNLPSDRKGLDLDQSYADLHLIAGRPHPYNSHSNDDVRLYLMNRLTQIAAQHESHVHISSDLASNSSFVRGRMAYYFEGTNILVKVDGTDGEYLEKGGVLFSSHYDSVSTAPGATDDGMGVATLLSMVEYFSEYRAARTAIFFFNNGEEDGLLGAEVLRQHPWSAIPDTFLNLEGAASGGRPMLFRATSAAALYAFLNKNVPHPHANVLSADAFAARLVRSNTDYSVYETMGMEGADFAFYKGRSKYHTKYDSVPHTEGGRRSLWSMMEATRGAGYSLLNDGTTHSRKSPDDTGTVYFDLFAAVLVVFQLRTLLIFNICMLTVAPVIIVLLVYTRFVVQRSRMQQDIGGDSTQSIWSKGWEAFKKLNWLFGLWRLAKFWLALVVGIGLQIVLVVGYVKINPFIVYSRPYIVLTSFLALAFLSTTLVMNIPITAHYVLPEQQKLTVMLQSYLFTWILLLASTIAVGRLHMGGLYWVSAWNSVVFVGCILGLLEATYGAKGNDGDPNDLPIPSYEGDAERRHVTGIRYEVVQENDDDIPQGGHEVETEPTEITPLITQRKINAPTAWKGDEEGGAIGWWILQMLVLVPAPAILIFHLGVILVDALSQTLADGNRITTVYSGIAFIAFFTILPMAPFSIKMSSWLTSLVFVILAISLVFNALSFPFSTEAPLKIFFQQKLEVTSANSSGHAAHVYVPTTELTGVQPFLENLILSQLPSSWNTKIHCAPSDPSINKPGLTTCKWQSINYPSPGYLSLQSMDKPSNRSATDWLSVDASRTSTTSVRFHLRGVNTRDCTIYFDKPTQSFNVHGSSTGVLEQSISQIRLYSRNWEKEFIVDVDWPTAGSASGRVACEWSEYASASAGARGDSIGGSIPALEEVISFLPRWAVASKTTDGLVEVWSNFTVLAE